MSLDKSRIPKLSDSSRKFIPKKERNSMKDPFMEKIARTRIIKGTELSRKMVETRSQKSSEGQRAMLEVEIHPDPALDDNRARRETERIENRRLASESTRVEEGQNFAASTGTLDREETWELSDVSNENMATTRSPTDNTMMHGVTEKPATSSSFSERVKNTMGNFFPFAIGAGTGDEAETQEEEEDYDKQDNFESQIPLNSSNQENDAYTKRETGSTDHFGVVRSISKPANGTNQSGNFVTGMNWKVQPGKNTKASLSGPPVDPEAIYEETSRQRSKARDSTSTTLPGTDRVTLPLVTPLVANGASFKEALTSTVGSIGEQNEQMSLRISELERAVHVVRESLREEINHNRQEVSRSEKRLKERTDEHVAKNLSRMTREAEQRETRLRDDMAYLADMEDSARRADSWDSSYQDRLDDGDAHSGYHGQAGWSTRKQE